MHAAEKNSVRMGLIAGQGDVPALLIRHWRESGITPVIVGLDGITPTGLLSGEISRVFSIGQAGYILNFFKHHSVKDIVMVGALKRPNFLTLRTDSVGFRIMLKLLFRRVGDDGLLKTIRKAIEAQGFAVRGAHEFLPEILTPAGVMGDVHPTENEWKLILDGFQKAKFHGAEDKGQSIVIGDGRLAYETESGTNALIRVCAGWRGAVLVKVSKPQQDLALDMPTIGPHTIQLAQQSGFRGIAVEAGKTMMVDKDEVIKACNKAGLFLVGAL